MIRGTTPTFSIAVRGIDLSSFPTIYITIKQGNFEIEKTGEDIKLIDSSTLEFSLTQKETLSLNAYDRDNKPRDCQMQLRAISEDGIAVASDITHLRVEDVLKEGVINATKCDSK